MAEYTVTATLTCSGGQWELVRQFEDGTQIVNELTPSGGNLVATLPNGDIITVEKPCSGLVTPEEYPMVRKELGCNFAIFGVGDPEVCTDPEGDGGPCHNVGELKVEWTCCTPLDGWDGAGWYCVRDAGPNTSPALPVELLEEDKCDQTIIIVSGPFATKEEAEEECGVIYDVDCGTGCDFPQFLKVTITGLTPDPLITYANYMTREAPEVSIAASGTGYHIDIEFDGDICTSFSKVSRLMGYFPCSAVNASRFFGSIYYVIPELDCEPSGGWYGEIDNQTIVTPGTPIGLVTTLGSITMTVEDIGGGNPDC